MKSLKDFDFENKRVLVRADFNVPLQNSQVLNDFKIRAGLPTIEYLLKQKAKIILLSHLGRPTNNEQGTLHQNKLGAGHAGNNEQYSLKPLAGHISKLLNQEVGFLDNCLGEPIKKEIEQLKPGQIVLLENLRFHKGELDNLPDFSRALARLGEIFVNDAFGVSHRAQASLVGLPEYLPKCAGLLLEKEIKALSRILEEPLRPLVVIIGGVKISTKIKVIKSFLEKADNLILGGALANTVISAKDFAIGKSVSEEEMVEEVKKLELTDIKLHIPVDVVASAELSGRNGSRISSVGHVQKNEMILDIGPETIGLFKRIISQAKMIFWNGPMGLSEKEEFSQGSREIAQAIAQSSAFSVVGGGETIALLEKLDLLEKIGHVCTGGGAMLKFLAGEKLPGLEALE